MNQTSSNPFKPAKTLDQVFGPAELKAFIQSLTCDDDKDRERIENIAEVDPALAAQLLIAYQLNLINHNLREIEVRYIRNV
jgi:hypothetical protein